MDFLISSLSQYKYLILLPLAIIEGPIVTVIAGMFCSGGLLNPLYVLPILVVGDTLGDSFYYSLGRWSTSPVAKRIGNRLGVSTGKLDDARIFFHGNSAKMIFVSKIFLGIGILGLVMAGNAKVHYGRFLSVSIVVAVVQSVVYLGIGLLFGKAFIQINQYLNWFAACGIIAFFAILVFLGIRSLRKTL